MNCGIVSILIEVVDWEDEGSALIDTVKLIQENEGSELIDTVTGVYPFFECENAPHPHG